MAVFTNFRRGTLTSLVTRLQRTCHCLQSFYNFQHPSSHNPQKSDIGFHDHRVYFIIIHKNPTLCVGRVHTSSYCKTMTLTSAGVVLFFNKNNIIAKMQFTCISCNKCLTKYALQISVIGINYL